METIDDIELNGLNSGTRRMIKQFSGALVIIGSGEDVFWDLKSVRDLFASAGVKKFDAMAINMSFLSWKGPLQHLVTLHQERIQSFHELANLLPEDRPGHIWTHSHMEAPGVEFSWPIANQGGTSALFAVKIAILLGYEKIILCGVPLLGSRRFYDSPYDEYKNNFSCRSVEMPWFEARMLIFKDRVRSMSGKSKDMLGEATKGWLEK